MLPGAKGSHVTQSASPKPGACDVQPRPRLTTRKSSPQPQQNDRQKLEGGLGAWWGQWGFFQKKQIVNIDLASEMNTSNTSKQSKSKQSKIRKKKGEEERRRRKKKKAEEEEVGEEGERSKQM